MLVVTRKQGQSVFIGGRTIKITVLNVDGGQVRLGFDAPDEIDIWREEIRDRMDTEKSARGNV
jgi:carbon storage regulator